MGELTTHRERMRAKGAQFFTGREEQVKAFERALKAVEKDFEAPYEEEKTFFAISGEGGLGKTWLCWEFERICKQKDVQSIYLDMSRHDEPPISSLTDFLRLLCRRFPESKAKKLLGAEPFAEFDKEYARLLKLEQQLKDHNKKKSLDSELIEQVSEVGAKAVVGFGEELPVGGMITKVVGKDPLERVVKTAVAGGLGLTRNFLKKFLTKFKMWIFTSAMRKS
jgi:hypothetical protein